MSRMTVPIAVRSSLALLVLLQSVDATEQTRQPLAQVTLPETIRGKAQTPDGMACANARVIVELLHFDSSRPERDRRWQTTTADDGSYQIETRFTEPIPTNRFFEVRAETNDLAEMKSPFVAVSAVAASGRFPDVKLARSITLRGRIIDSQGHPAKNAFVFKHAATIPGAGPWFPKPTAVGADGRFAIAVPTGPNDLPLVGEFIVLATNGAPERILFPQDHRVDLGEIRLKDGTVVQGRLFDEHDQPVADALIAAEGCDYGRVEGQAYQWTVATRTNQQGEFRFSPPFAEKIRVWAANFVRAMAEGDVQTLTANGPDVLTIPKEIDLGGAAAGPPLSLTLRAVPQVRIRGVVRWPDGQPASGVVVQPVYAVGQGGTALPVRISQTDATGQYVLSVPVGITQFSIAVSGSRERGDVYLPYPVGEMSSGRSRVGQIHFEAIDRPLEGVDWELRPRNSSAAHPVLNPGEAELAALDRQFQEKLESFQKQSQQATTDAARIKLITSDPAHDAAFIQSFFDLEKKHRGTQTGLLSLAFVMRLAQGGGDPESAAAKGRERALALLTSHYAAHEDLDLCLERLRGGCLVAGFESLCRVASDRSPHPHVRAAALLHWASLLREFADASHRLPALITRLRGEPDELSALAASWLQKQQPLLDAIDEAAYRDQAATIAQRVRDDYPNVRVIARAPAAGSQIVLHRSRRAGEAKTYADRAETLLFELKHLTIGRPAPDFEGHTPDGRVLKLSELRGKVVVVMFSANWCAPCKKLYPVLRELRSRIDESRLEIVSIMADAEVSTVKDAIDNRDITWHALWDGPECPIAVRWNVQNFPTLYIIDAAGTIRERDPVAGLPKVVAKPLMESAME